MLASLTKEMTQSIRTIQTDEQAMAIFGPQNSNLRIFEDELDLQLNTRGKQLIIDDSQEQVIQLGEIISQLEILTEKKNSIKPMDKVGNLISLSVCMKKKSREIMKANLSV